MPSKLGLLFSWVQIPSSQSTLFMIDSVLWHHLCLNFKNVENIEIELAMVGLIFLNSMGFFDCIFVIQKDRH